MPFPNKMSRMFAFNECERDDWVAAQAALVPSQSRVIDIGAGSCPYRAHFAHCEYRAHDFAKLEQGQLRGGDAYAAVDYISDICDLPVPDGSFDVALCTEVLEHIPDPIRAVGETARVLRSGGRLILTAPLGSGLHQEPYHFYGGYTPHWYRKFLGEAGFVDISIQPNRGFFSHYGQECIRFLAMLAPWRGTSRLPWFPLWLVGLPWCLLIPLLAKALDRLDREKGFTVGYHVTATKG